MISKRTRNTTLSGGLVKCNNKPYLHYLISSNVALPLMTADDISEQRIFSIIQNYETMCVIAKTGKKLTDNHDVEMIIVTSLHYDVIVHYHRSTAITPTM